MDDIKLDCNFSVALICESADDIAYLKRRLGIYSNGVTVFPNIQNLKNELSVGTIDVIFISLSGITHEYCESIVDLKADLCKFIPIIIISKVPVSQDDIAVLVNAGVEDILLHSVNINLLKARLFQAVKKKISIDFLKQEINRLNDAEETYLNSKLSDALRIQTSRLQGTLTSSLESIVNLSASALKKNAQMLNDEMLENTVFQENLNSLQAIERESVYCNKIIKYFADHSYLIDRNFAMDTINKVVIDTVKLFVHDNPKILHKIEVNLDRRISKKSYISSEALGNAIYSVLENASFFVSCKENNLAAVFVTTKLKFNCIEVIIKDNGIGISEDKFGLIFKPFFSTVEGKNGLGLFRAKDLIDMHKGTISVNSKIGEYAEFTISLPIIKDKKK